MHDTLEPRHHPDLDRTLRDWFAARIRGDLKQLQGIALPHSELAALTTTTPPPDRCDAMLGDLARATWRAQATGADRALAHVWFPSHLDVLPVVRTAAGWRIDARWAVAATTPDDALRAAARAFYGALLAGDIAAMQEHAFDPRGLELLGGRPSAPVDRWDFDLQAAMLSFVEVGDGQSFPTPTGPQPLTPRHREFGIRILVGLTLAGELSFQLRQRDGAWTVIPFLFVQAEVLRRGGSLGAPGPG